MAVGRDNIGGLRRRLSLLLWAREALAWAAGACFAAGVAVLAMAAIAPSLRPYRLHTLWLIAPAVVVSAVLALRRVPKVAALRAAIDRYNDAGGMVMARQEVDLGDWGGRIGRLSSPRLAWRPTRRWAALAAGAAFLGVSLLMPAYLPGLGSGHLNVDHQTQRLTQQVELLVQQDILPDEQAKQILDKLQQIRRQADATDPARTWESLDHIQNQIAQEASKAAQDAMAQRQAMAKTQELANQSARQGDGEAGAQGQEGGNESQSQPDSQSGEQGDKLARNASSQPDQMDSQAMNELAEALQAAMGKQSSGSSAGEGGQSGGQIPGGALPGMEGLDKLLAAAQSGTLSAEQLQQLAQQMGQLQGQLDERLMELAQSGLLSDQAAAELAQMAGELGELGGPEGMGGMAGEGLTGMGEGFNYNQTTGDGPPGRGGVSRGRGDAAMIWDNGTDAEGVQFKREALPAPNLAGLKTSAVVGVSRSAPTDKEQGEVSAGGALGGAQSGGGSAYTHQVMPRHRGAVSRYFEHGRAAAPPAGK